MCACFIYVFISEFDLNPIRRLIQQQEIATKSTNPHRSTGGYIPVYKYLSCTTSAVSKHKSSPVLHVCLSVYTCTMSNTEGMQVNLIDGPDPDFQGYGDSADVRYSVLRTPQSNGKRSFFQEPFKVATACLVAFCLLLLMVLVATNVHSKNSTVQDLTSSSAEAHMLKTCANVTELTSELQTLRKEKRELEEENSQLKAKIAKLEASASTPVQVTQSTPGRVTAKDSCPSDWHYFSGSCYFISSSLKSWSYGQDFCKQKGGHLAIIHTAEEQTFIWDLLPRGFWNGFWIGISDEKVEDDWYWVDGTKLVGGFWEDGEPNNHINEDCCYIVKTQDFSRIATKSWYDAPCYMSRYWICEKKINASP